MSWNSALDPKKERPRADSASRPRKVVSAADASAALLKRAKAWLAEVDPAIQGQDGSKVTFRAACELVGRFKLSRAQALELLEHDYNPRCKPVWSRAELEHKVDDAIEETQGESVKEDRPRPNSERVRSDAKPENDYEHTNGDAPDAPPDSEPRDAENKSPIEIVEAADIFAPLEEPDWLIEGVIRRGSLVELVGYGSSGKSWIAADTLLSVAAGVPMLGRFGTKQGAVLALDWENGLYEMRRRLQAVAKSRGLWNTPGLSVSCMPSVYMSDPKFGRVVEALATDRSLITIDTLKAASPGIDENDSSIRGGLDALRRVGEKTGCAFLVLLHSKKVSGSLTTIDAREAGRGSSAIFDAADSVLHITYTEGEPLRVQQTKARQGRQIEPFSVTILDGDGGAVHVVAEDAPVQETEPGRASFEKICSEVLEVIRAQPGASGRIVRAQVHSRPGAVGGALELLERHGVIRNTGTEARPKWFPTGKGAPRPDEWGDIGE